MSDSRELRIAELKRLLAGAQSSVEQLSTWRRIIQAGAPVLGEQIGGGERLWLLQAIDNRRAMILGKIEQFTRGIEQAHENAQPEIGALFIDGRRVL
jgi:hypothetical protein